MKSWNYNSLVAVSPMVKERTSDDRRDTGYLITGYLIHNGADWPSGKLLEMSSFRSPSVDVEAAVGAITD